MLKNQAMSKQLTVCLNYCWLLFKYAILFSSANIATTSEKKKKPRSRKKQSNVGTGVQVEIINLKSDDLLSGEEKSVKQDSAKRTPKKSSRKPKEGKENQDTSQSPKKSPHKSPSKGRPGRKSTNSESTENEKFPDYWTEELAKSSLKDGTLVKVALNFLHLVSRSS